MSATRFAIATVVGAGITVSAFADTRSVDDKMPPAATIGVPAPNFAACQFWQSLTFRPPMAARATGQVLRSLEMIQCAGR